MIELSPVEDHPTVALVRRASHERVICTQLGQGGLLRWAEVPRSCSSDEEKNPLARETFICKSATPSRTRQTVKTGIQEVNLRPRAS